MVAYLGKCPTSSDVQMTLPVVQILERHHLYAKDLMSGTINPLCRSRLVHYVVCHDIYSMNNNRSFALLCCLKFVFYPQSLHMEMAACPISCQVISLVGWICAIVNFFFRVVANAQITIFVLPSQLFSLFFFLFCLASLFC